MTMPKGLTDSEVVQWKKQKTEASRLWQIQNKEKADARKRQWYLDNRDLCIQRASNRKIKSTRVVVCLSDEDRQQKRRDYMVAYYLNNKTTIIKRWLLAKKEYMKRPMYRVKEAIRSRVSSSIRRRGYGKKTRTFEILGCSFDDFVRHIESQFYDGMSWCNRNEWHIDHKVPVSIAENEDELIKLNHYLNLRPLYKEDNFRKNDQMLDEFIPLRIILIGR